MKTQLCLIAVLLSAPTAFAQTSSPATPAGSTVRAGGGPFCLFELPAEESGKRRLINLAIVQFVDITPHELKLVYGGGAFGSGYEAKVTLTKPEDANAYLDRINAAAAKCR